MCSTLFGSTLFLGVQHGPQTNDFPTYCLRLRPADCAPLVMQLQPTAEDVSRFVRSSREEQVLQLYEALRRGIDVPLVVPVPPTRVVVAAMSPLILSTASESGRLDEDEVLALCNVAHVPVTQDADFAFKHDGMDDAAAAWVMTVVVRAVAPSSPRTWRAWLATPSPLDAHYVLHPPAAAAVAQHLDHVLRCTYDDEDDDPGAPFRVLLHRTHFATHVAFAYINNVLFATWLSDMARGETLPYVRAALLSRMLITWDWQGHESTLPDFKPQKLVLVTGIREWVDGLTNMG